MEGLLERHELTIEDDVEEIVRLYDREPTHPTEARPLPLDDQRRLPSLIFSYDYYRNHPLYSYYKEPPNALEKAFLSQGWGKVVQAEFADLTPADVMAELGRVKRRLQQFAVKHRALRLVGEQCRLYQQKWQSSGPLAHARRRRRSSGRSPTWWTGTWSCARPTAR